MTHKEQVHGLPKTKFELTEKNYRSLMNDLCSFFDFRPNDFTKPRPTIYGKGATTLTSCLDWLAQKAGI